MTWARNNATSICDAMMGAAITLTISAFAMSALAIATAGATV